VTRANRAQVCQPRGLMCTIREAFKLECSIGLLTPGSTKGAPSNPGKDDVQGSYVHDVLQFHGDNGILRRGLILFVRAGREALTRHARGQG
jgi:hypothetical protein